MRISDWSSDVCSSDPRSFLVTQLRCWASGVSSSLIRRSISTIRIMTLSLQTCLGSMRRPKDACCLRTGRGRSEEHTSELKSLMRISYAVFCLTKKKRRVKHDNKHNRVFKPHQQ